MGRSLIENIVNSKNHVIYPFSNTIYDKALKLYLSREDKEWGLTDCYSFEIMGKNNISRVLTADIHFKQVGMEILLK